MAVVPTSPIRVFPQAVNINPADFAGPDPVELEKFPLLRENIKHEQLRLKLEQDKLKFAMSEAGRQEQALASDLAKRKAVAEVAKAEAEARGMQPLTGADLSSVLGPLGLTAPAPDSLEREQTVEPFRAPQVSLLEDSGVTPAPAAPTSPVYQPAFSVDPAARFLVATDSVQSHINQKILAQVPSIAAGARVANLPEVAQKVAALKESLQPRPDRHPEIDERGIPVYWDVIKVGDDVVEITSDPRVNVEELYRRRPAQKVADEGFAKRVAETPEAQTANARQNINRLMRAAEYLAEAEASPNPLDQTRLTGLLPPSALKLLSPNKAKAINAMRTVIQQSLRETLGAQFARVEGEMMMDRAFDPLFDAEANFELIRDALSVAESAMQERNAAGLYFRNNGTLAGFEPSSGLIDPEGSPNMQMIEKLAGKGKAPAIKTSTVTEQDYQEAVKRFIGR
jgi:hypothetical protein